MRKSKFMILSAAAIIGLCSCDQIESIFGYSSPSSSKETSSQVSQQNSSSATDSSEQSSQTSISQGESEGYTTYYSIDDRLGENLLANCFYGGPCLDSVGSKKVLVLPVSFRDASPYTAAELDVIDKAYNGEPSDTGWQSLSSFYEASSYGKLNLDCVIAPAYRSDYSTSTFQQRVNTVDTFFDDFLQELLDAADETLDLSDFDLNQDGYVDALQVVYKNNGTEWDGDDDDDTSVWWNYTHITSEDPGMTRPNIGVYFWSEFKMIQSGYYDVDIDAHTLIHEMGHMLGIDDYYSYNENTDGDPAGLIDMMNMNVGDHCATTKLLLGWVDPFVPDGTKEEFNITLRDFESTGDCLMLIDPTSWNGTGYDEYFMLEYYTPTGLNESDAVNGYQMWYSFGDHGKIYQQPGLKVFHADNRLGVITYNPRISNYSFTEFTDEFIQDPVKGSFSTIVSSNSSGYSYSGYNKLEFISGDGVNYFNKKHNYDRQYGRQKLLFGTSAYNCGGATFNATTCSTILANQNKMNDNTAIPYGFEVLSQTDDSISIKVSKL